MGSPFFGGKWNVLRQIIGKKLIGIINFLALNLNRLFWERSCQHRTMRQMSHFVASANCKTKMRDLNKWYGRLWKLSWFSDKKQLYLVNCFYWEHQHIR